LLRFVTFLVAGFFAGCGGAFNTCSMTLMVESGRSGFLGFEGFDDTEIPLGRG
jgi:hypothetical protein